MVRHPETTGDLLSLFNARVSPRSQYFRQTSACSRPLESQSVETSQAHDLDQSTANMSVDQSNLDRSKSEDQNLLGLKCDAQSRPPRPSSRKTVQDSAKLTIDSPLFEKSVNSRSFTSHKPAVHKTSDEQTESLSASDIFILANRHLFLPLLPSDNYVTRLMSSTGEGVHTQAAQSPLTLSHHQNGQTETGFQLSAFNPSTTPDPQVQPEGIDGLMKPHQLQGLAFMAWLHAHGVPGILGDEMGLGKTLQTLAFLQYVKNLRKPLERTRPHLIVCPLSVLNTWIVEARKFAPSLKMMRLHGSATERQAAKKHFKVKNDDNFSLPYDCVVTNYETVEIERSWFARAKWSYIILDEGTRIKNIDTKLAKVCQTLSCTNRLILTGTPVQNDLKELWALLHWLYPKVFNKETSELFSTAFDLSKGIADRTTIAACKALLNRIMLRRTKISPGVDMHIPPKREILLYVSLSEVQRQWYRRLITRAGEETVNDLFLNVSNRENHAATDTAGPKSSEDRFENTGHKKVHFQRLLNLLIQLRMLCVHPYLIQGVQPEPYTLGPHIIHASSKFVLLSKLLDTLVLHEKRKVLIFSGFTGVLDLCEDLLHYKGGTGSKFRYLRLDGKTLRARRNLVIRLFQDKELDYQVMLVSIKAGGIGINLQSASEVIFLDEDWNPQIMLQAEARAHRYGQTQGVTVYKMCTTGSVEQQMLNRIQKKLYLSTYVVGATEESDGPGGATTAGFETTMTLADLQRMIRGGAQTLTQTDDPVEMLDWNMDKILEHCQDKGGDGMSNELTAEEWLAEAEKIECAVFEGVKLDRGGGVKDAESQPYELRREDRRVGKETTAMVDGYVVSKESTSCKEWEAVPTLADKNLEFVDLDEIEQEQMMNQEHCHICKNDAHLISCSGCPRSYHSSCIDTIDGPKARKSLWFCPQHSCFVCKKNTSDAGGMLYRCRDCEKAFCEDCLDWNATDHRDETLDEFQQLGYGKTATAFYLRCQICTRPKQNSSYNEPSTPVRCAKVDLDDLGYSPGTSSSRTIHRTPSLVDGDSPGSSVDAIETPKELLFPNQRSSKRKFGE